MSDGAIAQRCGVSRPSVVSGMRQLLAVGLVEKVGLPVNQVQAYRILQPMFRAGICRGCKADFDLAARVKQVCTELGANASPEQIAERMKQITEERGKRRLTARVRRVLEAVA
jgi:DNA-binding transcriptional regulator GbsR (MarR family)